MEKTVDRTSMPHDIILEERCRLSITGVQKVLLCSPEQAAVKTAKGTLHLSGEQINVEVLDLEAGQARLTGQFRTLEYSQEHTAGGLLRRILR